MATAIYKINNKVLLFFFVFCLFRAAPMIYGGSQARGLIRARAMRDPSHFCDLHHSSRQCWILNPLSKARDQTRNLVVTSLPKIGLSEKLWCQFQQTTEWLEPNLQLEVYLRVFSISSSIATWFNHYGSTWQVSVASSGLLSLTSASRTLPILNQLPRPYDPP